MTIRTFNGDLPARPVVALYGNLRDPLVIRLELAADRILAGWKSWDDRSGRRDLVALASQGRAHVWLVDRVTWDGDTARILGTEGRTLLTIEPVPSDQVSHQPTHDVENQREAR